MDWPTQLWVISLVPQNKVKINRAVELIHFGLERERRLHIIEQIVNHMEEVTQAKLMGPVREKVSSFCWLKIKKCT